jgi:hypothetical protein
MKTPTTAESPPSYREENAKTIAPSRSLRSLFAFMAHFAVNQLLVNRKFEETLVG